MRAPRRDHYLAPAPDDAAEAAFEQAIEQLGKARDMNPTGDPATRLHLIASLLAQAEPIVLRTVADAHTQRCSWAEIADLLGVTRASAWQRFANRIGHDHPATGPQRSQIVPQ